MNLQRSIYFSNLIDICFVQSSVAQRSKYGDFFENWHFLPISCCDWIIGNRHHRRWIRWNYSQIFASFENIGKHNEHIRWTRMQNFRSDLSLKLTIFTWHVNVSNPREVIWEVLEEMDGFHRDYPRVEHLRVLLDENQIIEKHRKIFEQTERYTEFANCFVRLKRRVCRKLMNHWCEITFLYIRYLSIGPFWWHNPGFSSVYYLKKNHNNDSSIGVQLWQIRKFRNRLLTKQKPTTRSRLNRSMSDLSMLFSTFNWIFRWQKYF